MKPSDDISTRKNSKISKEVQEEMDSVKAFDVAKAEDDEIIPFEQAIKEIETRLSDL
jgi:hypothetical protein